MRIVRLEGKTFGRLKVIRESGRDRRGNVTWLCICSHGGNAIHGAPSEVILPGARLSHGSVKSCGCLIKDTSRLHGQSFRRHGMSNHPLYMVWRNMKARCLKESRKDFYRYGGRGIGVCKSWLMSDNFFAWALSHGWKPGLEIERRNNDRPYSPSNCHFVSHLRQMRNRSNTTFLVYKGERKPLTEWAEIKGIKKVTLDGRIRAGWSVKDALTMPLSRGIRRDIKVRSK